MKKIVSMGNGIYHSFSSKLDDIDEFITYKGKHHKIQITDKEPTNSRYLGAIRYYYNDWYDGDTFNNIGNLFVDRENRFFAVRN